MADKVHPARQQQLDALARVRAKRKAAGFSKAPAKKAAAKKAPAKKAPAKKAAPKS